MFKIDHSGLISQFKESRFYSQATEIREKISEVGQDALEVLKTNKQLWIFTAGLLTMGAIYTSKLISCIDGQADSSTLIQECNDRLIADGIKNTMAITALATALAVGASQYLAIRRQTRI